MPYTRDRQANLFKIYDDVRMFIMFIGQPRTGHSIVGSMLDAHPEVIISTEFDIMGNWATIKNLTVRHKNATKYLLFYRLHEHSLFTAMFGRNAIRTTIDGEFDSYSYHIPGQWQGTFRDKITVEFIVHITFHH